VPVRGVLNDTGVVARESESKSAPDTARPLRSSETNDSQSVLAPRELLEAPTSDHLARVNRVLASGSTGSIASEALPFQVHRRCEWKVPERLDSCC